MIVSEIKRILKESFIVVAVLLILLCLLAITDRDEVLAPTFEIFLLLYASYVGWAILDRERQEGAMEYLLALPISRTVLFIKKLVPRLTMILLLYSFHWILHHTTDFPFLLKSDLFLLVYITIFFLSLSLSITLKSFIATFFISGMATYGLFQFIEELDWSRPDISSMFQASIFLLCFPILFFILFQKLDIRPVIHFNKRFVPISIILCLLVVGGALLTNSHSWGNYYWATNGTILRSGGDRTNIITPKGKSIRHDVGVCPLAEDGKGIYVKIHTGMPTETLARMGYKDEPIEKLYPVKKGWRIRCHPHGKSVLFRNGRAHFLITQKRSRKLKLVILGKDKTEEIPIFSSFPDEGVLSLIMVTGEPFMALIATVPYNEINSSDPKIYRIYGVSQTGHVKKHFEVSSFKVWKENLLLVNQKKGFRLLAVSGIFEALQKIEGKTKIIRRRNETHHARKVLLKFKGKNVLLDMKNGKIIRVPPVHQPYFYQQWDKDFRIVRIEDDEIFSLVLENKRWIPEKIWISKVKSYKRNPRIISNFGRGLIVHNSKKFEIFPYPEKSKE